MSDWQNDLAAIASSDAATPINSHFPFPNHHSSTPYSTPAPAAHYPPLPGVPKTMLKSTRSINALKTISAINLPMSAPQPQRIRHVIPVSRLPVPKSGSSTAGSAAATATASASASAYLSTKHTLRPLTISTNNNSNSNGTSIKFLKFSDSKSLGKQSMTMISWDNVESTPLRAANVENATSLFDQSTTALRHRHRTMSISESEGGTSEEGGQQDEAAPDSPDLSGLNKEAYINDVDGPHSETVEKAEEDLLMQDPQLAQLLEGGNDENELSPFLDTPGRKRGCSMPLKELSGGHIQGNINTKSYASTPDALTFASTLISHPSQPPLKSSRISYPPKTLNFGMNKTGRDPLYASVPASSSGCRPDELFLASILNGHSHYTAGLTAGGGGDTIAEADQNTSPIRPRALSKSSGSAGNMNGVGTIASLGMCK